MGRKRLEIDVAEVVRLASRGLTEEQIAESLGISITTLERRKREGEVFAEAIRRGRALGIAQVANAHFEAALAGNVTAQIFFLKSRAGWKETQTVEVRQADEWTREQILSRLFDVAPGGRAGGSSGGAADGGN